MLYYVSPDSENISCWTINDGIGQGGVESTVTIHSSNLKYLEMNKSFSINQTM